MYLNYFSFQLSSVILAFCLIEYEIKSKNPFALILLQLFSLLLTLPLYISEVTNDFKDFVKEHQICPYSKLSFKDYLRRQNSLRFFIKFIFFNLHSFSPRVYDSNRFFCGIQAGTFVLIIRFTVYYVQCFVSCYKSKMHSQIDFIQKLSLGKVTFGSLLKRQMSTNNR